MNRFLPLLLLLLSVSATAVIETYEFENEELRERYQRFIQELRCPKCQNQNLADSNAPIAEDLRRELHTQLHEGLNDEEIVTFMVARYGEFILYKPKMSGKTLWLWLTPLILLLIALTAAFVLMRKARRIREANMAPLDEGEQKQLDELLERSNKHD